MTKVTVSGRSGRVILRESRAQRQIASLERAIDRAKKIEPIFDLIDGDLRYTAHCNGATEEAFRELSTMRGSLKRLMDAAKFALENERACAKE